jgi:hypothetical protein
MIPSGEADPQSHPGARGGLDARLGASLDSPEDVSPRFTVRSRRSGRAPPYGAPSTRAGYSTPPGSMPGGSLMWA